MIQEVTRFHRPTASAVGGLGYVAEPPTDHRWLAALALLQPLLQSA